MASPPSLMFPRPVIDSLKPTPTDSSAEIRPRTVTWPLSGARMPARVRNSVDLPAPFRPITPSTLPFGTVKDTSRSAGTSRSDARRRLNRSRSPALHDWSRCTRYDAETLSTSIAGGAGRLVAGDGSATESETESKGSLMRDEHLVADDEEEQGPEDGQQHLTR